MKKIDPLTQEEFMPVRRNQKFKSRSHRIKFNNERAAKLREAKSSIDRALTKNYIIISGLVSKGQTKSIPKVQLLAEGFDHRIFTHYDILDGKTCRCLYNFYFPYSNNPETIIVKNP